MRKLIKSELSTSWDWMIELWKTPNGYSVYISRGNKHEQRLDADTAEELYQKLLALL